MGRFQYKVYSILTGSPLGELPLQDVVFNDPLRSPGQLTGYIALSPLSPAERIKRFTEPDAIALYVSWWSDLDGDGVETEILCWGGIISSRLWKRKDRRVEIFADQIESWLKTRRITPDPVTFVERDADFNWTGIDQFQIARDLADYAIEEPNHPRLVTSLGGMSGRLRDRNISSFSFMSVYDAIESIARRIDGFEWSIEYRYAELDGYPENYLALFYPERTTSSAITLAITIDNTGGNIKEYDWPEDASPRRDRVWAVGEGEPPVQPIVQDTDPDIALSQRVFREDSSSWSGVVNLPTLSAHAQAERAARNEETTLVSIDVTCESPDLGTFIVGDRARLIIKDEWMDIDLPYVRIVERTMRPRTSDQGNRMTLVIDVADNQMPTEVL
jgi:hypothetical protein